VYDLGLLVFQFLYQIFPKLGVHLLKQCLTFFPYLRVLVFECPVYVSDEMSICRAGFRDKVGLGLVMTQQF